MAIELDVDRMHRVGGQRWMECLQRDVADIAAVADLLAHDDNEPGRDGSELRFGDGMNGGNGTR